MVGIVDYGAGNLRSVQKALEAIGVPALISAFIPAVHEEVCRVQLRVDAAEILRGT